MSYSLREPLLRLLPRHQHRQVRTWGVHRPCQEEQVPYHPKKKEVEKHHYFFTSFRSHLGRSLLGSLVSSSTSRSRSTADRKLVRAIEQHAQKAVTRMLHERLKQLRNSILVLVQETSDLLTEKDDEQNETTTADNIYSPCTRLVLRSG